jgi:purine-binding chemotaxis protein CheW
MSVNEITETRQYLTFKLGNEIFATDVAKVREVLDLTTITAIPRTPGLHAGRHQSARQRRSGRRPPALL